MAHQHDIKRLSQCSTAEEYTWPFFLHSFQPIISHCSDIFEIRRGSEHHPFCDLT
jgi:hypothetical protein